MGANNIAAVVLAAGRSSRMGRLKPLLPVGDRCLIERAIASFFEAGVSDVRVVVGHCRERIAPVVEAAGARVVVNDDYERGMFSSVLSGLAGLESDVAAAMILPGDVALVCPATIARLAREHDAQPDKIVMPCFEGRSGHPVLIPAGYFGDIFQWSGEDGLRGALRGMVDQIERVEVSDRNVLFDVDVPADYDELQRRRHCREEDWKETGT